MPLLSLVPPSLLSVFPLFLCKGSWHLPPVSAAASPAPGGALEQGKDPNAQRQPGKGRDPENYSEYIFLLCLHEQQGCST